MSRWNAALFLAVLLPACGGDLVADPGPGAIDPATQVVRLLFTEEYPAALARFGLTNADTQIRHAIRAHLRENWANYDVAFLMTDLEESKADQARVATVEMRAEHPRGLFSNDNSICEKDLGNRITDEYVGGFNQAIVDCGYDGTGGVFVSAQFSFSKKVDDSKGAVMLSSRFDEVFGPYSPELGGTPIRGEPSPDDADAKVAVHALGAMIAATTTSLVGSLCGLPANWPGFHRSDDTGSYMDGGSDRTFEERAQLDGQREHFHPDDDVYLRSILPLP